MGANEEIENGGWPNRVATLASLALLGVGFAAFAFAINKHTTRHDETAAIAFDRTFHDFGQLTHEDSTASTVFAFTNAGRSTLEIIRVASSCECTVGELLDSTLEPGEHSEIVVAFDPAKRHGKSKSNLAVYTNDPKNLIVLLTVAAQTPARFEMTPPILKLGTVNQHAIIVKDVRVKSNIPGKSVSQLSSSFSLSDNADKALWATVSDPEATGDTNIEIIFDASRAAEGPFTKWLRFQTNDDIEPELALQVSATVSESILTKPKRISIRERQRKSAVASTIHVEHFESSPFAITSIDSENSNLLNLDLHVEPNLGVIATSHQITLTYLTPDRLGPIAGELLISVTGKEASTVTLPIVGYIDRE